MNPPLLAIIRICQDLKGLIAIHLVLLAMTVICANGDSLDFRFQVTYLIFVLPGWLLAPRWTPRHSTLVRQYAHALITSFLIHGWLVFIGTSLGLGFRGYFVGFAVVSIAALADRFRQLSRHDDVRKLRISGTDLALWLSIILFVVIVYRMPRSNDIGQFMLQQQDAAVSFLLTPSPIGMSGMGLDQAMPRWKANHWHLWPSLMAVASGLPVSDVLLRFAPIPLAFASFVVLLNTLQSLCGRRMPLWAVTLAVLGPVLLWYRSYNAFTYSFRITNSFCLDKDFCLFLLIPSIVYLAAGWLRGAKHFVPVMILSVPAILRFHPMTAVYLVLLTPFVLIGFQRARNSLPQPRGSLKFLQSMVQDRRAIAITGSAITLLTAAVVIGDAQSFHHEIHEVIGLDFADSLSGRPLHHWIGHYALIRELGVPLDTSQWTGNRLHLRLSIISDSGLFVVAHLAWVIWGIALWRTKRWDDLRRWFAVGFALATLWIIILASYFFLPRYPYLFAGFERLHWFAFIPALVSAASGFKVLAEGGDSVVKFARGGKTLEPFAWLVVVGLVSFSSVSMAIDRPTGLTGIRGLNSRLDYELPEYKQRLSHYQSKPPTTGLVSVRPSYLTDDDRVLVLGSTEQDRYWLMKQSIYWQEPYAEAFALHVFGDQFRRDREQFYMLVDRITKLEDVRRWFDEKRITLVIDHRDGGDEFLEQFNRDQDLGMRRIEPGVWRY